MSIILNGTTGITTPDITSTTSTLGSLTQALDLGSTGQIVFPTTQNASANANTLDDYEEGSWTPGINPGTSGAVTVQSATGKYTKVGNVVTVQLGIQFTRNTAVGHLNLTGFPFSFTGGGTNFSARGPSFDWYEQSGTALIAIRGIGINGTTYMTMYALTAANIDGTGRAWNATDASTTNTQLYSQFSYLI
jgi:hypothetical protein